MSYISQVTQPDGEKLRVSLKDTEANAVAVKVDGSAVTQPVSAASLPLPTGASTSALQTTGNGYLNSIDSHTPALGQALMASSSPVVIASNQSAVPVSGTVTATVADGLGVKVYDTVSASYVGLKFADGKPRIIVSTYYNEIAEGNIPAHTPWTKMGYNSDIGTSEETMWSYNTQYVWITTAGQIEVLSSSANDTAAGTGARTVRVQYLKSDYTEGTVDLTLNGATPVASGAGHADVWRINSFRVMTTGTSNFAEGNLTLRQVTGGRVVSYIRLGKTRARACFYTVPHGKTLYVTSIAFSAVGTKYLVFTTHANWDNSSASLLPVGLFWPYSEVALLNEAYTKELEMPTKLGEHTDLKVSVVAEAAGSLATCHLRGWLE